MVIVSKQARKAVSAIFEYQNPSGHGSVYSIHFKDENEDVVWVEGKIELYKYLQGLNKKEEI